MTPVNDAPRQNWRDAPRYDRRQRAVTTSQVRQFLVLERQQFGRGFSEVTDQVVGLNDR
jgi:hypothetical protein